MDDVQKLKVSKKEDRLILAAILVDNGYKVWTGTEKVPDKRSYETYVYYAEQEQA